MKREIVAKGRRRCAYESLPHCTIAILVVAVVLYLATANAYLYGDEETYIVASRSLFVGEPFRDVGEIRHRPITTAPLFAIALAPLTGLGVVDLRILKVVPVLFTGGGLLFAFLWIRQHFRPTLWNLVLAVVAFNPLVVYLSHHLTPYALFFLLVNATLYLLALYERGQSKVVGLLALFLGLMSLTNYAGAGTCLGVMLYLLWRKRVRHLVLCGLVYVLVIGGWLGFLLMSTVFAPPTPDTTFAYDRVFVEKLILDRGPLWLVLSLVGRMGWSLGSYALRNLPWLLLGWFFSDTSLVAFQPQYVLKMALGIVPSALLAWGLVSRARTAWREKSALPAFYWPFLGHIFFIATPSETSAIYLMPFLLPLLYFTLYGAENIWQQVQKYRPGWKLDVARVVLAVLFALGIGNALLETRLVYLEAHISSGKRVEPYTEHVLSVLLGKLELPRPYDWLYWLKGHTSPQDRAISFKFSRYTYLYLDQPGLDLAAYGAQYEVADVEADLAACPQVNYMIVDAAPGSRPTNRVFEALVAQQPARFGLLFYSPYSQMAIYSVGPATQ